MYSFENNSLGEALIRVSDAELDAIEGISGSEPHKFSEGFLRKMNRVFLMSNHKYSTVLRHRIRRASLVAAVLIIVLCMSITVYAIVKANIPLNVGNQDAPWSALVEGSKDETLQENFEYITPKTPEGFHVEDRVEEPLNLVIYYKNDLGEGIIYSQAFGEGGQANLNIPDASVLETMEETINERNAVITRHYGDIYSIVIEDGVSVFVISGDCSYDILHDIAVDVTDVK